MLRTLSKSWFSSLVLLSMLGACSSANSPTSSSSGDGGNGGAGIGGQHEGGAGGAGGAGACPATSPKEGDACTTPTTVHCKYGGSCDFWYCSSGHWVHAPYCEMSSSSGGVSTCDAATWAAIEKGNVACKENSDCCFLANNCHCEFATVHVDDFQAGKDHFSNCGSNCGMDCIYQPVKVECVQGQCKTTEASQAGNGFEYGDHCGMQ